MNINYKLSLGLIIILIQYSIQAAAPETISIAGHEVNVVQMAKGIDDACKSGHQRYQQKISSLEREIAREEQEIVKLTKQLESKSISERMYQLKIDQINRRIEKAQKSIEAVNKHAVDVDKIVTNFVAQGTEIFMHTLREDATRKTQIATAAATAAAGQEVKNKGQLEMAQFLLSRENLERTGITLTATGLGLMGAWFGCKFGYTYAQRFIGMPKLARETSDKGLIGNIVEYFSSTDEKRLDKVVLPPQLKATVNRISESTKKIMQSSGNHRNVLFYGLPGTGKTMIARAIAYECGLDYTMMSGSDFSQFTEGEDVNQLHQLFERAQQSKNGMLIFIDEIEVFLAKRSTLTPKDQKIFNAFLFHTGQKSSKIKIIGATNKPKILDIAVLSRFTEWVEIPLPDLESRIKIVQQYLSEYYGPSNTHGITIAAEINEEYLKALGLQLETFSGRDLEDLVASLQEYLDEKNQKIITPDIINCGVKGKFHQRLLMEKFKEDTDAGDALGSFKAIAEQHMPLAAEAA